MPCVVIGGVLVFSPETLIDNVHLGIAPTWHDFLIAIPIGMIAYTGIETISNMAEEARDETRTIPRAILLSVAGIAVLYLAMQTSILGVLPWREAQNSQYIVSAFVERLYGTRAAAFATVMILWIAFASLFTTLLSYSRVPFAAAEDGNFFPVFARVHPTKHFPHVSLLFLGVASLAFSVLFRLASVIKAIIAVRILVQFISQGVGVMILRRRWPPERLPFKMWLYPWPAVLSILGWAALFYYTGWKFALGGIGVIALGIFTYMIQARYRGLWPFAAAGEAP